MSMNESNFGNHCEKNMVTLIKAFHENINLGPQYACTCFDELWYRSSVMKCNPINYKARPQDILDMCINGVQHSHW